MNTRCRKTALRRPLHLCTRVRVHRRRVGRGVIAVQGERLDWNYIRRWYDAHGTRELLDKVRASTLPFQGNGPLLPRGTP